MDPKTLLIVAGAAIAVALVVVPRFIEWIGKKRGANSSRTLVREYEALQTLNARATRLGCENLKQAVSAVKDCFMDGDKLE